MEWLGLAFFGVTGVAIALTLAKDRRQRRYRRRWDDDQCLACGHDLRAAAGRRCPECGEPARQRLDARRLVRSAIDLGLPADAESGTPPADAPWVFESLLEAEAAVLRDHLRRHGIPADRRPFVHRRYGSLVGYRVHVAAADVDRATQATAAVLVRRSPG